MAKMNNEFERQLWKSADALRGNQSAEEYMHVVFGILFLKHLSDNHKLKIEKYNESNEPFDSEDLEDKEMLALADISFILPEKAQWDYIAKHASQPTIGEIIDNAFEELEKANHELLGLFEKNYNRESLDQGRLGEVVSQFTNMNLEEFGEDIIGRTYEYFLGEFFKKQGQKGGEFYTPMSIVRLMVEIVNPKKGKLYDPAAGTGGMLVQARKHLVEQNEDTSMLMAYGQEFQNKTWKLSRINLLLHGFPIDNIKMGSKSADTFTEDLHKGERFDYFLANPPFNLKNWGAEKLLNADDKRWEWGLPPKGNANYAWMSHMLHKLKDTGMGATVLANGSLSSSGKDELNIRKNFVSSNIVDTIIALPDKLFYTTGIPACIWVFNKNKKRKDILMIDASNLEGNMLSKKLRELTADDVSKILKVYKEFKGQKDVEEVGFAKSVSLDEIKENDFSFVPGRYVGFEEEVIDKEAIKKEIAESSQELKRLLKEFEELTPKVLEALEKAKEA